jgi:uroporphyrinogen-III decarboxylase
MSYILFTLIGAFIGFLVSLIGNYILHRVHIGGIDMKDIASSVKAQLNKQVQPIVNQHLSDTYKIVAWIQPNEQSNFVKPYIEKHIDHFLQTKLPEKVPAIGMLVGPPTIAKIKEGLMEEFDELAPKLIEDTIHKNATVANITLLSQKIINKIDNGTILRISHVIMKKVHNALLLAGLIIGAIIGLIAAFITNSIY